MMRNSSPNNECSYLWDTYNGQNSIMCPLRRNAYISCYDNFTHYLRYKNHIDKIHRKIGRYRLQVSSYGTNVLFLQDDEIRDM